MSNNIVPKPIAFRHIPSSYLLSNILFFPLLLEFRLFYNSVNEYFFRNAKLQTTLTEILSLQNVLVSVITEAADRNETLLFYGYASFIVRDKNNRHCSLISKLS